MTEANPNSTFTETPKDIARNAELNRIAAAVAFAGSVLITGYLGTDIIHHTDLNLSVLNTFIAVGDMYAVGNGVYWSSRSAHESRRAAALEALQASDAYVGATKQVSQK